MMEFHRNLIICKLFFLGSIFCFLHWVFLCSLPLFHVVGCQTQLDKQKEQNDALFNTAFVTSPYSLFVFLSPAFLPTPDLFSLFLSNFLFLFLVACSGSILGIVCALLGFVGIFREDRRLLTVYSTLLWAVFALYVSVGYIAFRRDKNHLNQHLQDDWIHSYTRDQRLLVQRQVKKK